MLSAALGELTEALLGAHLGGETEKASRLINPATYHPGPGPNLEGAHSNTHLRNELLEHVTGLDLQIQISWNSMMQGNRRIFKRSSSKDPLSIVKQKPEASNQISDPLQTTLTSKDAWTKGDSLSHSFQAKIFLLLFALVFFFFWHF